MDFLDGVTKILSILTALMALLAAVAGLTAGSRRRRLESYYKAAADDEAGRSPQREAILRSLQREAVGWSIADRAVPKAQLLLPVCGYLLALVFSFMAGRDLGLAVAAGRPVWRDVADLLVPESLTGAVMWGPGLALILLLPTTGGVGHFFSERRRIAYDYSVGTASLRHVPHRGWAFLPSSGPESHTDGNEKIALSSLWLHFRVAVAYLGATVQVVYVGFVTAAGTQRVISEPGPWIGLVVLASAAGMMAVMSLVVPPLIGRASRAWVHPAAIEQSRLILPERRGSRRKPAPSTDTEPAPHSPSSPDN